MGPWRAPPGKWTLSAGAMQGPPRPFTCLPGCLELKCYQGQAAASTQQIWCDHRRPGPPGDKVRALGREGKVACVAARQAARKAGAREARQEEDVTAGMR